MREKTLKGIFSYYVDGGAGFWFLELSGEKGYDAIERFQDGEQITIYQDREKTKPIYCTTIRYDKKSNIMIDFDKASFVQDLYGFTEQQMEAVDVRRTFVKKLMGRSMTLKRKI